MSRLHRWAGASLAGLALLGAGCGAAGEPPGPGAPEADTEPRQPWTIEPIEGLGELPSAWLVRGPHRDLHLWAAAEGRPDGVTLLLAGHGGSSSGGQPRLALLAVDAEAGQLAPTFARGDARALDPPPELAAGRWDQAILATQGGRAAVAARRSGAPAEDARWAVSVVDAAGGARPAALLPDGFDAGAIAPGADGGWLVVGRHAPHGSRPGTFAIEARDPGGGRDAGWGQDGRLALGFDGRPAVAAVRDEERLVVATATDAPGQGSVLVVAGIDIPAATLDQGFGRSGLATLSIPEGRMGVRDLQVADDGRVRVLLDITGSDEVDVALVGLDRTGRPDRQLAGDGLLLIPPAAAPRVPTMLVATAEGWRIHLSRPDAGGRTPAGWLLLDRRGRTITVDGADADGVLPAAFTAREWELPTMRAPGRDRRMEVVAGVSPPGLLGGIAISNRDAGVGYSGFVDAPTLPDDPAGS